MVGQQAAQVKLQHSVKVPQFYKTAANIAKRTSEERRSLKDLVFNANKHLNIQGLYALIIKTFHHEDTLERLIQKSKILKDRKVDPWLIKILITELLFGKKCLNGDSKPVQAVLSLHHVFLAELKKSEKAGTLKLDSYNKGDSRPRYVRINTLSLKVRAAVQMFCDEDWKQVCYDRKAEDYSSFLRRVTSLEMDEFIQDLHIKELFIFPNKTEFYRHPLYTGGSIILQDKASCLASWLLKPPPGSITLDMCAAPGMKTIHLACLMKNKGFREASSVAPWVPFDYVDLFKPMNFLVNDADAVTSTLFAVDSDKTRFETLCKQVEKHGATCVKTLCMDAFLLDAKQCPGVQYILVDPTCSGSGAAEKSVAKNREKFSASRLQSLSRLQSKLLRYALTRFPDVKRIVYSTCSLNIEENEMVVKDVLASVNADPSNPVFEVVDNKLNCKWIHHGGEDFEWGPRCIYAKPDIDLMNGFFIAVIERVGSDEKNISRNENEIELTKHKKRKKLKENNTV